MKTLKFWKTETLLCAAIGVANNHHRLEACAVYGKSGTIEK
jgi:hypothetical protein